MKKITTLVMMLAFCMPITGWADGQSSFAICVACHGVNGGGNPALNSPALAGQEAWYVKTQINNFKAGIRGTHKDDIYGKQMQPMSMVLATDQMTDEVAAYINQMAPVKSEPTIQGDAAAGKTAYMICAACHGADAKGLQALNAPSLILQQDWYLVRQIQNYKKGIRGAHAKDIYGQQMRPMASTLVDDQAIKNVVAYIATLRD
jgi:cytochrome c oxidase subunit 2